MKKLFLLCVIAVLAIGAITAKENNNVKTTVFTSGDIYCQSCVNKIMNNIPTLGKGIEDVKVDVQTKTVTVKYNTSKNNDQNIIKGLKKLDVNAMVMAGNAQQSSSQPAATPYCTMPAMAQDNNHCQNGAKAADHDCTNHQKGDKAAQQQCQQGQQAASCTPTATSCDNDQNCNSQASGSCCGGGNAQGKKK